MSYRNFNMILLLEKKRNKISLHIKKTHKNINTRMLKHKYNIVYTQEIIL